MTHENLDDLSTCLVLSGNLNKYITEINRRPDLERELAHGWESNVRRVAKEELHFNFEPLNIYPEFSKKLITEFSISNDQAFELINILERLAIGYLGYFQTQTLRPTIKQFHVECLDINERLGVLADEIEEKMEVYETLLSVLSCEKLNGGEYTDALKSVINARNKLMGSVFSVPKILARVSYVTLITFSASIIASCSYADDRSLPKAQSNKNEGSLLSVENSNFTSPQNLVVSEKKISQSDKGYSESDTKGRERSVRDEPLKPDVFKPLFEGDIAVRTVALGEGPYKIGKPINGFVSDHIKKAFDYYNFDIEFATEEIAQQETAREICDFVKVTLFSDEIDLSEFYWRYPHTKDEPLKKLDSHFYQFTDPDGRYVSFNYFRYEPGYDPRNKIEEGQAQKFRYSSLRKPQIYICDLDQKTILHDVANDLAARWTYNSDNKCLRDLANKAYYDLGKERSQQEIYDVGRAHGDSLSDIGFFMFDNQIHVVTIRPFFRFHWWGGREGLNPGRIEPEISVDKLSYNQVPNYFVRERVCSYHVDSGL